MKSPRISLCTFSCHQHWKAVHAKLAGTKFSDAPTFFDYARSLGAEGVQTAIRDESQASAVRERVEKTGGWYEGDVKLPTTEAEVTSFDEQVRLVRAAGGNVARSVLTGNRRYETFKSMEDVREFRAHGEIVLRLAEPVLRKYQVRLALENHKDQLVSEILEMLSHFNSEWLGLCVDTGNNIGLLEEPHQVVEALAPFAASVHLKDMAVQPYPDGFLLSEVPLGTGCLDLKRMIKTLVSANPGIGFNLEMGTRDPLKIPCITQAYWAVFENRPASELARALAFVQRNPPSKPPPSVSGKPVAQVLDEEEANNRASLDWMRSNLR